MEKEEDRLSILEKVERGEITIEEAGLELEKATGQTEADENLEKELERASEEADKILEGKEEQGEEEQVEVTEAVETVEEIEDVEEAEESVFSLGEMEKFDVPTRRERKLALAEKFQNWNPQMMVKFTSDEENVWEWPWKDKNWQWMWQNMEYPIYVSHSTTLSEKSELQIVAYQGDLFIHGWDKPTLKINGAIFDMRVGQEDNVVRVASSTGQLQIWAPSTLSHVVAKVKPGDIWISNLSADIDVYCQSGDLDCEQIKGNVKAFVNSGDARLMGIEGDIDLNVMRGHTKVREISSSDVNLKATEGDILLNLDSIDSGRFRCENEKGDINLLTNGELSCELQVEATDGGRVSPVMMPWQQLLGRSENKLHGILKSGGASITLLSHGGNIYIQEAWVKSSYVPSSS